MPPCALRLGPLGPVKVTIVEIVHWNHTNEVTKNSIKNLQKSIQNPPKTLPTKFSKSNQNPSLNPPRIHSWSSLGPSWPRLGPSWRQEALENETRPKTRARTPPTGLHFGRVSEPCWRYVEPGCAPRAYGNNIW